MSMSFSQKVLEFVATVPLGTVVTYKEVAAAVGQPKAARAVGNILRANRNPSVPCHRVIRSDGQVGGYNGLRGDKVKLLKAETTMARACRDSRRRTQGIKVILVS